MRDGLANDVLCAGTCTCETVGLKVVAAPPDSTNRIRSPYAVGAAALALALALAVAAGTEAV